MSITVTAKSPAAGAGLRDDRPPRRAIPVRIKRQVCERQNFLCRGDCGRPVDPRPRRQTHFDHSPALRLRDISLDGRDYIPHQHSPEHIDALCPECHHAKTRGTGATTAGSDIGKIKKERHREDRRAGIEKPKQKIQSRGFQKGIRRPWPKRKLTSAR